MGQGFCTQSLFFLENLEPLRRRLIFTLTYNDFCFLFIGQESEDDLGTGKQVRSKVSRYLNYLDTAQVHIINYHFLERKHPSVITLSKTRHCDCLLYKWFSFSSANMTCKVKGTLYWT